MPKIISQRDKKINSEDIVCLRPHLDSSFSATGKSKY